MGKLIALARAQSSTLLALVAACRNTCERISPSLFLPVIDGSLWREKMRGGRRRRVNRKCRFTEAQAYRWRACHWIVGTSCSCSARQRQPHTHGSWRNEFSVVFTLQKSTQRRTLHLSCINSTTDYEDNNGACRWMVAAVIEKRRHWRKTIKEAPGSSVSSGWHHLELIRGKTHWQTDVPHEAKNRLLLLWKSTIR